MSGVWICEDIRKAKSVHCARPGCFSVVFYEVDGDPLEGKSAAGAHAVRSGWQRFADDLICPTHAEDRLSDPVGPALVLPVAADPFGPEPETSAALPVSEV